MPMAAIIFNIIVVAITILFVYAMITSPPDVRRKNIETIKRRCGKVLKSYGLK